MLLDNIYVINLDKDKERLHKITENFKKYNLKFNRFPAVYGKNLSKNELEEGTTPLCRSILCNFGVVGCALSHKALWKKLVDDIYNDYYVILEDDATIDNKFVNIIPKIEEKLVKYDIDLLQLYCYGIGCSFKTEF